MLKYFVVAALPRKFYCDQIIFNSPFFAHERDTIGSSRTTTGTVEKREFLSRLPHVYSAIRDVEIGEQVHVVFQSCYERDR